MGLLMQTPRTACVLYIVLEFVKKLCPLFYIFDHITLFYKNPVCDFFLLLSQEK